MPLFQVDPNKCLQDGACVDACPARLLEFKDGQDVPSPIPEAEEYCISCGHCVAVCPAGALDHRAMRAEDCPPIRSDLPMSRDMVEQFLRANRSIRSYTDQPADPATLRQLISIASYAPSGHNRQPVHWLVVQARAEVVRYCQLVVDWMQSMIDQGSGLARDMHLQRVVEAWHEGQDVICRNAPQVIVAHAPKQEPTATAACTIALTYLDLAAPSFGLGTCWAGFFNAAALFWPAMHEALDLPPEHITYGAMMIGQPDVRYHRLPLRSAPRISWR